MYNPIVNWWENYDVHYFIAEKTIVSSNGKQNSRQYMLPHFSKDLDKVPFSCNLVILLENIENAQTDRKIDVSGNFRISKFQNVSGEHAPRPP